MIIVLRDRSELIVSQKTGENVAKSLQKSLDGYLTINKHLINKRFIDMIKPGGITEADVREQNDPNKRLKQDNRSDDEQHKAARKKANEIRRKLKKKMSLK